MIIGITGGVGAGKSTILEILEKDYGAAVILSDHVARELMEPMGAAYEAVVAAFGNEILTAGSGSEIDREALSRLVFKDEEKRRKLNSLTHPATIEEISHRINIYYSQDPDRIILLESAILTEAGCEKLVDEVWAVIADNETRIKRLMETRDYPRQRAADMIATQKTNEQYVNEADFVIYNNGSLDEVSRVIAERIKYLNEGN